MNWGYKIFVVIILFVVSMLGMVYVAFQQTNEMYDNNYYEKEMHYQELIDASERLTAAYNKQIVDQTPENIVIQIPKALINNIQEGSVDMLLNTQESSDKHFQLQLDTSGLQLLNKSDLKKGMYKVRVKWKNDTLLYYSERNLKVY